MPEPLAAFGDVELTEEDTELVERHQQVVRDHENLSVDGLVYEYRTQFHQDPLVEQDETAYYLSVRGHVWDEFADAMGVGDEALERLKGIHEAQFEATVGSPAESEAMVLTKE
ncbi:hypothetical protein [Halorussus halophilus]|uniref:hypothetical protein n=1 Tax=Halorussus halophilus TaxID=2650975 RepID=UPI001300D768|nr:hypothetical protein [Halorussus halophilus]